MRRRCLVKNYPTANGSFVLYFTPSIYPIRSVLKYSKLSKYIQLHIWIKCVVVSGSEFWLNIWNLDKFNFQPPVEHNELRRMSGKLKLEKQKKKKKKP